MKSRGRPSWNNNKKKICLLHLGSDSGATDTSLLLYRHLVVVRGYCSSIRKPGWWHNYSQVETRLFFPDFLCFKITQRDVRTLCSRQSKSSLIKDHLSDERTINEHSQYCTSDEHLSGHSASNLYFLRRIKSSLHESMRVTCSSCIMWKKTTGSHTKITAPISSCRIQSVHCYEWIRNSKDSDVHMDEKRAHTEDHIWRIKMFNNHMSL